MVAGLAFVVWCGIGCSSSWIRADLLPGAGRAQKAIRSELLPQRTGPPGAFIRTDDVEITGGNATTYRVKLTPPGDQTHGDSVTS